MDVKQAIYLGIERGATAFAPVSLSGHDKLTLAALKLSETPPALAALLALAAILVLVIVFRERLGVMLRHPLRSELKWLVLSAVPLIAAQYYLGETAAHLLPDGALGICFLVTSAILLVGEAAQVVCEEKHRRVGFFDAFAMSLLQMLCMVPGLSRLGCAITAGACVGLSRKRAADFAYLMYLPLLLFDLGKNLYTLIQPAVWTGASVTQAFADSFALSGGITPAAICACALFAAGLSVLALSRLLIGRFGTRLFSAYTGLFGLFLLARELLGV